MSQLGGHNFFLRPRLPNTYGDGHCYRVAKFISKKIHRCFAGGKSKFKPLTESESSRRHGISGFPQYFDVYWKLPDAIEEEGEEENSPSIVDEIKQELKRMSAEVVEEETILDHLSCPKCRQFIRLPSICCENGHFMCSCCKTDDDSCLTCGATSFPNKANKVFDSIVRGVYYPCANQAAGCSGFYSYDEIGEHQSQCRYERTKCRFASDGCPMICRLYSKQEHEESCPYGVSCLVSAQGMGKVKVRCNWKGRKEDIFSHVCENHGVSQWLPPSSLQTNVTFLWMLPVTIDFQLTELFRLTDVDELFYFHVKCEPEGDQYIAIQHIGSKETSSLYMYTVEFKYGTKQIFFRDEVIPWNVGDVFSQPNCCCFHYKFLMRHFCAERICDCFIRIYRKGKEDKRGRRILNFLGTNVTEEKDGRISNRESFQDKIEYCLESIDIPNDVGECDA